MKSLLRPTHPFFISLAAFLCGASVVSAQSWAPTQVKAEVKDVSVMMQKTPEFNAQVSDNKKDGKRREWLEMEIEFETISDSKIGVIPEILIQYYVVVKAVGERGVVPQMLTDSYKYRNVVDKEESFAIIYVSPTGLTQLAGEPGKFKESDVVGWGVEILHNGRVVSTASSEGNKPFWNTTGAGRVTGLLMPKEKTPFQLLWIDRHAEAILN